MYVVVMQRKHGVEPTYAVREDYALAVERVHLFFKQMRFTIEEYGAYDPGSGRFADNPDDEGYTSFDDVRYHESGQIEGFMHMGGDGPTCFIYEAE